MPKLEITNMVMVQDIKDYGTFTKIEPVNKGWSSDKKYYIETADSRRLLLHVADISEYDRKKAEFEIMKQVAALGVQMSKPLDFGTCDDGKRAYSLLTWCDGEDAEVVLKHLTETEQYNYPKIEVTNLTVSETAEKILKSIA